MILTLGLVYPLLSATTTIYAASMNGVSSLPALLTENSPQFGPCAATCEPYWSQTLACFKLPVADASSCVCGQDYISEMATCFTCLVPFRTQEGIASNPEFKTDAQFAVGNAIAACQKENYPLNATSMHL